MLDLLHLLTFIPFDYAVGTLSLLLVVSRLTGMFKRSAVLIQISLLLVKMAKSYYATHPGSKGKLDSDTLAKLDSIYKKELAHHDQPPLPMMMG